MMAGLDAHASRMNGFGRQGMRMTRFRRRGIRFGSGAIDRIHQVANDRAHGPVLLSSDPGHSEAIMGLVLDSERLVEDVRRHVI